MEALILAAGYASRMQSATNSLPKQLLEVAGKPIITHIIEKLEGIQEIRRVHVVTNELYFNQFLNWRETIQKSSRLTVKIINDKTRSEESKLGTLGDIYYAVEKEYLQAPILIIGGDNLFNFSLQPMINTFKEKKAPVISLYDVENKELLKSLGNATLDEDSRIIYFEEKPVSPRPDTLSATLIYLYTNETLNDLRQYVREGHNLDKSGSFIQWLHARKPVYGHVCQGRWFDIGTPESLEEARNEFT